MQIYIFTILENWDILIDVLCNLHNVCVFEHLFYLLPTNFQQNL